jgi:hypothetical protein
MSDVMKRIVVGLFFAWLAGFTFGMLFRVLQGIFSAIISKDESE